MFSDDNELTEEDILEAVELVEMDLCPCPFTASSINSSTLQSATSSKLQTVQDDVAGSVSVAACKNSDAGTKSTGDGRVVPGTGAVKAVVDPAAVFCLSEDDFPDDLNDLSIIDLPLSTVLGGASTDCQKPVVVGVNQRAPAAVLDVVAKRCSRDCTNPVASDASSPNCVPSVHYPNQRISVHNSGHVNGVHKSSAISSSRYSAAQTHESPQPVNSTVACSLSSALPLESKAATSGLMATVSTKRKRKFPGPAGVLPKLKPGVNLDQVDLPKSALPATFTPKRVSAAVAADRPSSQPDCFSADAWQEMLSDLEPHATQLLDRFSIREIIRLANGRQLVHGKVPVVCAVIESVTARGVDAGITLHDPTGSISATVHREVIKEYAAYFHTGTVVVLRQVGVLSPLGRNFYLNITSNNLVRLYLRADAAAPADGSPTSVRIRDLSSKDCETTTNDSMATSVLSSRCSLDIRPVAASPDGRQILGNSAILKPPNRPSPVLPKQVFSEIVSCLQSRSTVTSQPAGHVGVPVQRSALSVQNVNQRSAADLRWSECTGVRPPPTASLQQLRHPIVESSPKHSSPFAVKPSTMSESPVVQTPPAGETVTAKFRFRRTPTTMPSSSFVSLDQPSTTPVLHTSCTAAACAASLVSSCSRLPQSPDLLQSPCTDTATGPDIWETGFHR